MGRVSKTALVQGVGDGWKRQSEAGHSKLGERGRAVAAPAYIGRVGCASLCVWRQRPPFGSGRPEGRPTAGWAYVHGWVAHPPAPI